jgi:tetratricopeptide (TPR) repeat protein
LLRFDEQNDNNLFAIRSKMMKKNIGTLGASKKVGFKLIDEEKKVDDLDEAPTVSANSSAEEPLVTAKTSPTVSTDSKDEATSPTAASASRDSSARASSPGGTSRSPLKTRKKFRLPLKGYFRNRRRGGSQGDSEDDETQAGEADDPVMAVFQKRYKNRVRWAVEEKPSEENPKAGGADGELPEGLDTDNINEGSAFDDKPGILDPVTPIASNSSSANQGNIKKFVKGALFGGANNRGVSDKEFQKEVAKEVEAEKDLVWESNNDTAEGGELIYTSHLKNKSQQSQQQLTISFTEDPQTRAAILKLIKKGKRAQCVYYRYEYAVKYFVRALEMATKAKYPDHHPTVQKAIENLNDAHHKLSSYNNSANIVKIGIKYEDSGELIRALKMYSIAYRIRRDNLSRTHPSLVVLLNMLGSIQTKRGEYEEAMQIYELALKDPCKEAVSSSLDVSTDTALTDVPRPPPPADGDQVASKGNLLARSVTYREMGTIFEKWERREEALKMYHMSLDCVAEWKAAAGISSANKGLALLGEDEEGLGSPTTPGELDALMEKVHVRKSYANEGDHDADKTMEKGEMEMTVSHASAVGGESDSGLFAASISYYDSFFPPHLEIINAKKGRSTASAAALASGDAEGIDRRDDYADIDVALTIHQIAQCLRKQGNFTQALEAYAVALRGMKYSLGNNHPNVAAILGNFGNLQKEMGDLDAAYDTYQEVLGIESHRLGLSHPDVAITLHNIATIDAARGNHQRALKLYRQVMALQEKLFGEEHISIAVTSACMGDVYEQLGQMKDAFEAYEDSLRIKSAFQGHHSLEVTRILHKLAKVALKRGDHRLASSYISRAIFSYQLNKIADDHEWVVDAYRDSADIDASLALTKKMTFEC